MNIKPLRWETVYRVGPPVYRAMIDKVCVGSCTAALESQRGKTSYRANLNLPSITQASKVFPTLEEAKTNVEKLTASWFKHVSC